MKANKETLLTEPAEVKQNAILEGLGTEKVPFFQKLRDHDESKDGPSEVQIFNEIEKSENDERAYRGMILKNGLRVLLISDPDANQSAASLDVNVGSWSDPPDLQGLAHFVEHLLFLGTEKVLSQKC